MKIALLISGVILLAGCGFVPVTDGDIGLNDQNAQAAGMILAMPGIPIGVAKLATLIKKNADQMGKNFGDPKDPAAKKKLSEENSEALRKQSEQEHKTGNSSSAWLYLAGLGLTIAGWAARATGVLGSVPILGTLLTKFAPALAHGANKSAIINTGLQVAIDVGRDQYDKISEKAVAAINASTMGANEKAALVALLPKGDILVGIVQTELNKLGVLKENTDLYRANDTGVA